MPRLTALVLGGADCLRTDRAAAEALFAPDLIVACNHAGRDEPGRIDHWATMHPELFLLWIPQRAALGHPPAGQLWHARHRVSHAESTGLESWGGSSGLLCVKLAIDLGCSHIVLAGVPMLKTARHYDDDRHWIEARQYWPAWERRVPEMAGRVRSLSGWTAKLLGMPTRKWLDADDFI